MMNFFSVTCNKQASNKKSKEKNQEKKDTKTFQENAFLTKEQKQNKKNFLTAFLKRLIVCN